MPQKEMNESFIESYACNQVIDYQNRNSRLPRTRNFDILNLKYHHSRAGGNLFNNHSVVKKVPDQVGDDEGETAYCYFSGQPYKMGSK